ncbi:unnamed protein product [Symbiodinium natans]|uniref:PA14 domain-containing protein n=1 Tax=Symbiodinium natans TaxID=878477 RepID=A0A812P8R2_9DINO|nr:unnamed protein product [Symbiodinium natans]
MRTLVSLVCLLHFVPVSASDDCGNDILDLLQRPNPDMMKLLAKLEENIEGLKAEVTELRAGSQAAVPTPGVPKNNSLFQGCRTRSSRKLATNQASAQKRHTAEEHHGQNLTQASSQGSRLGVLPSCPGSNLLLKKYGATSFTTSCCAESGLYCAGCARADSQSCLECAGGFLSREGKCISCADSAGWTNVDGKTCVQLAAPNDCNDVKSRGKSSNEACCKCGGGIVSPTPFTYPSVHLALGSAVHVSPSARTASRYSLNEGCELVDHGLTMDGATGIVTASADRPQNGAFSINCAVTAHQAPGVSYETAMRIGMDYLSFGAPVLFFSGSTTKTAQKAAGQWKDFSVMCAPTLHWLQVNSATGDLSRSAASGASGAVGTEDTTVGGQDGGICIVKAQHSAPNDDSREQGMTCEYCRDCSFCTVPADLTSRLSSSTLTDSVVVPDIYFFNNFSNVAAGSKFCTRCVGYLFIKWRGYYNFYIISNDGSRTYLDGQLVLDKAGCGVGQRSEEEVWLEAGYHDLEVQMCSGGGNQVLQLSYYGPDTDHVRIPIPQFALFHAAFTERQARFVALALQPWTALTYKMAAVSVTLGEQLPLLNLEEPTQQGLLKPSFFKVSCSSTPSLKYDFDDLLSMGLVEGYPVLEVTPEGSIAVSPVPALSAVFDSLPGTGSDRKRISLACSIWGAFPDLASLEPIKASLQLTLLDDICWVKKRVAKNYTVISMNSEAALYHAA